MLVVRLRAGVSPKNRFARFSSSAAALGVKFFIFLTTLRPSGFSFSVIPFYHLMLLNMVVVVLMPNDAVRELNQEERGEPAIT